MEYTKGEHINQYTKGEWKATGFRLYAGDRHIFDLVTGDGKSPCISIVELQSDLELASAAPDMYEALIAVVKMQSTPQNERTNAKEIWKSVMKALTKAEGK